MLPGSRRPPQVTDPTPPEPPATKEIDNREIKRLDGTSGSPLYAHFSETLAGVVTVRAFGHQRRFTAENVVAKAKAML